MLNEQLQKQIEQEGAQAASMQFHPKWSPDQNTACRITYSQGATEYAKKWQQAQQLVERYEKALKQIEQMSDPGDYFKAICDMKAIATKALTPKTGSDE